MKWLFIPERKENINMKWWFITYYYMKWLFITERKGNIHWNVSPPRIFPRTLSMSSSFVGLTQLSSGKET